MATVNAFIRTSKKNPNKALVRFRLRDGRDVQLFHVSDIEVDPKLWDAKEQQIKARVVCPIDIRRNMAKAISTRKDIILNLYSKYSAQEKPTSQWLDRAIDMYLNPDKYKISEPQKSIHASFDEFVEKHDVCQARKNGFKVLGRALRRFELIKRMDSNFKLEYDNLTIDTLREFDDFLRNEVKYFKLYPQIYVAVPDSRVPQQKGQNTISGAFKKLRTFVNWSIKEGVLGHDPFKYFKIEEQIYGTPFYISIEERNKLYKTNLRRHPQLAVQRDIFVFQCLIGCRVGDLLKMKKSNVINKAIEYIPRKTKEGRPVTVRVPLNKIALEILDHHKEASQKEGDKLLPFISEQKYNDSIKVMFRAAGLTRMVTVINPTTREEEKRPINEIASSHLARRCFVGNLYKQVKDPNLVGALSGHKDGSKAFARYREIDEDIKTELVKLLE